MPAYIIIFANDGPLVGAPHFEYAARRAVILIIKI